MITKNSKITIKGFLDEVNNEEGTIQVSDKEGSEQFNLLAELEALEGNEINIVISRKIA